MLNPLHDVELPSNMTPETFQAVVDQDADAPVVRELTDAEILEAKKLIWKTRLMRLRTSWMKNQKWPFCIGSQLNSYN